MGINNDWWGLTMIDDWWWFRKNLMSSNCQDEKKAQVHSIIGTSDKTRPSSLEWMTNDGIPKAWTPLLRSCRKMRLRLLDRNTKMWPEEPPETQQNSNRMKQDLTNGILLMSSGKHVHHACFMFTLSTPHPTGSPMKSFVCCQRPHWTTKCRIYA